MDEVTKAKIITGIQIVTAILSAAALAYWIHLIES